MARPPDSSSRETVRADGRSTPTLAHVARIAGVSPATASRVINGNTRVARPLAQRVERAVDLLAYVPDGRARELRREVATRVVGYLVPDIGNPLYAGVFRTLHRALREHDCNLLAFDSEDNRPDAIRAAIDVILRAQAQTLIVASQRGLDADTTDLLAKRGLRTIFFDDRPEGAACSVTFDDRGGTQTLTRHLIEHGHRRVGLVCGSPEASSARERFAGYATALREAGLEVDHDLTAGFAWGFEAGREGTLRLLGLGAPPTAVLTLDPYAALGCLAALGETGRTAPGDVALATFADAPFASYVDPPLTCLAAGEADMGRALARLVLADEAPLGAHEIRLRLLVRGSCGCKTLVRT